MRQRDRDRKRERRSEGARETQRDRERQSENVCVCVSVLCVFLGSVVAVLHSNGLSRGRPTCASLARSLARRTNLMYKFLPDGGELQQRLFDHFASVALGVKVTGCWSMGGVAVCERKCTHAAGCQEREDVSRPLMGSTS